MTADINKKAFCEEVDRVLETYPKPEDKFANLYQFEEYMARFIHQLEKASLNVDIDYLDFSDIYKAKYYTLLKRRYGSDGWSSVFEMATTTENGLVELLQTIADLHKKSYMYDVSRE